MVKGYQQMDSLHQSQYNYKIESIETLYDELYICGRRVDNLGNTQEDAPSLIHKTAVFFFEPLNTSDPLFTRQIANLHNTMSILIQHYNYQPLKDLYEKNHILFKEALRYGLELTSDKSTLKNFMEQAPDVKAVTKELKNVIYSTIECASYFHAVTKEHSYTDSISAHTSYNLIEYLQERMKYAYEEQPYGYLTPNTSEKEFLLRYTEIKNFGISEDDLALILYENQQELNHHLGLEDLNETDSTPGMTA